jgi:hypothetical protein
VGFAGASPVIVPAFPRVPGGFVDLVWTAVHGLLGQNALDSEARLSPAGPDLPALTQAVARALAWRCVCELDVNPACQ